MAGQGKRLSSPDVCSQLSINAHWTSSSRTMSYHLSVGATWRERADGAGGREKHLVWRKWQRQPSPRGRDLSDKLLEGPGGLALGSLSWENQRRGACSSRGRRGPDQHWEADSHSLQVARLSIPSWNIVWRPEAQLCPLMTVIKSPGPCSSSTVLLWTSHTLLQLMIYSNLSSEGSLTLILQLEHRGWTIWVGLPWVTWLCGQTLTGARSLTKLSWAPDWGHHPQGCSRSLRVRGEAEKILEFLL